METIREIVNASYTFNDVVWYCWLTALAVIVACLAWYETKGDNAELRRAATGDNLNRDA